MVAMNDNNVHKGGIGFAECLTIVFIVLKLVGVIDWSWIWVLSPMWISIILVIVVLCVIAIIEAIEDKKDNNWLQ